MSKKIVGKEGLWIVTALFLIGGPLGGSCGTNTTTDDNGGSTSSSFALTSAESSDGFDSGGSIPTKFSCADVGGSNQLPTLSWSNPPDGTKSFAITMIDTTTDPDTTHMVVFDISSGSTSVDDEDQFNANNSAPNYTGQVSYAGPCPPSGDAAHTYQFTIYALSVTNLVNETGANAMDADDVISKIQANDLGSASVSGTFAAP